MVYLNKHINKLLISFTKILVFPFLTIHDTNNLYLSVLIPFLYQLFFLFYSKDTSVRLKVFEMTMISVVLGNKLEMHMTFLKYLATKLGFW